MAKKPTRKANPLIQKNVANIPSLRTDKTPKRAENASVAQEKKIGWNFHRMDNDGS